MIPEYKIAAEFSDILVTDRHTQRERQNNLLGRCNKRCIHRILMCLSIYT